MCVRMRMCVPICMCIMHVHACACLLEHPAMVGLEMSIVGCSHRRGDACARLTKLVEQVHEELQRAAHPQQCDRCGGVGQHAARLVDPRGAFRLQQAAQRGAAVVRLRLAETLIDLLGPHL